MVYGKMKDVTNSMPVLRYVCLKCKSYGIQIQGKCKDCEITTMELTTKQRNKDVCRFLTEREFLFDDYVTNWKQTIYVKQNTFLTRKCQIYTIQQEKVALSSFDLKRYVMDDNIHARALGHYRNNKE